MKLIWFFLLILIIPACENGVIISYNPENFGNAEFIKSEKLLNDTSSELNCEYGDASHKHGTRDSYYIYFTMSGTNFSPIISKEGKFKKLFEGLEVKLLDNDGMDDATATLVGGPEFISLREDETKTPNIAFMLDVTKYQECTGDYDACSLSGAGFSSNQKLINFLGTVKNFLVNGYLNYKNSGALYPMKHFFGVLYMGFSFNENLPGSGNTGFYYFGNGNYKSDYELNGDIQYSPLNNGEDSYTELNKLTHRKLWDNYISAVDSMKGLQTNNKVKNQNLVMYLKGYEEGVFSHSNEIDPKNKSTATEEDFMNSLTTADKIPLFISSCNDESCLSNNESPNFTDDVNNKLYKMACKTGGAYMPEFHNPDGINKGWHKAKVDTKDYDKFFKKIEYSVYGMWRIKVQLEDVSDGNYTGIVKITTTDSEPKEFAYKVIR